MAEDRTSALERRRAELLERRRRLREAGAAPKEIVPVVEELDRVEAELRAQPPPEREDDELRWRSALIVAVAAVAVAGIASLAAAFAFGSGSSSGATVPDDGFVHVRLKSALRPGGTCSKTMQRAVITWTWTVEGSGHDGEPATIRTSGPGLARTYRVPVGSGRVRLERTSPCVPAGTVWKARLVRVGSRPAELSH